MGCFAVVCKCKIHFTTCNNNEKSQQQQQQQNGRSYVFLNNGIIEQSKNTSEKNFLNNSKNKWKIEDISI